MKIELPMPPSVNKLYATDFKTKRRFLTKDAKIFRAEVEGIILSRQMVMRFEGRLTVTIELYPKDRRKFDIDGRIKALLDALESAMVFLNDNQVDDLRVIRCPPVGGSGYCIVFIEEMSDGGNNDTG